MLSGEFGGGAGFAGGAALDELVVLLDGLEGIGGRYFVDCNEAEAVDRRSGSLHGVAHYALAPDGARRLWDLSESLLAATR